MPQFTFIYIQFSFPHPNVCRGDNSEFTLIENERRGEKKRKQWNFSDAEVQLTEILVTEASANKDTLLGRHKCDSFPTCR